jgi:peptide/nickel transport system permease protein
MRTVQVASVTPASPRLLGERFSALLRATQYGYQTWAGVAVLTAVTLMALFAPLIATHDPFEVDLANSLAEPSMQHLLGTDGSGRDVFSRIVYGAQTSLLGPLAVVVISTVAGIVLGLVAAWRGGWADSILTRLVEVIFSFPGVLLALLLIAILGPGLVAPVIAMAIAYTPAVARLVRSAALQEKARPYIEAYELQGFSSFYIVVRRLLPNIASVVMAQSTICFGYAVMDLAALSYLGFGAQPPSPDWGATITGQQPALLEGALLPVLAPGIFIVIVVIAFNLVGEGLADRTAKRKELP